MTTKKLNRTRRAALLVAATLLVGGLVALAPTVAAGPVRCAGLVSTNCDPNGNGLECSYVAVGNCIIDLNAASYT